MVWVSYCISGLGLLIAFCLFVHLVPNYIQSLIKINAYWSKQSLPGLPFVLSAWWMCRKQKACRIPPPRNREDWSTVMIRTASSFWLYHGVKAYINDTVNQKWKSISQWLQFSCRDFVNLLSPDLVSVAWSCRKQKNMYSFFACFAWKGFYLLLAFTF